MKSNPATWSGGSGDLAAEPVFDSVDELRRHRKRQTALSYRLFGAFGWGTLGDGHITARDPGRTDCFWLLRYGVSFRQATVDDLVLVGPGGQVVEGEGPINMTAYYIHGPIHDARPEAVSVAHTHTPYATPWMANVQPFRMICQEATAFFRSQAIFEGEEVQVMDADTGKHIAAALDEAKVVFLRNHGPVTVGQSVEEAIGWFLFVERVAEVHVKAPEAEPISDHAAFIASTEIGHPSNALAAYEYAIMAHIPDPRVVD
ncbi:MAG: class II aldolase/adducin family protein [bacterium]|nr:class II aldolase/adducin family protein [bacterium]